MPENDMLKQHKEALIRCWAKVGEYWGAPRALAEVHAVLFFNGEPMTADNLMETLQISRGGASTSLRELVRLGLVRRSRRTGDRKEYFEAETDVWKMFDTIVRDRRNHGIEPILEAIEGCQERLSHQLTDLTPGNRETVEAFCGRLDVLGNFLHAQASLPIPVREDWDVTMGVASLAEVQRQHIEAVLRVTKGNKSRAANRKTTLDIGHQSPHAP